MGCLLLNESQRLDSNSINIFSNFLKLDVLGFVIGFFSLTFAIWQWIDSRKKKDLQDRVFQLAKANLENEKTEEILKNKKGELKNISNQLEVIKNEIPYEAKRTVLKDKLENAKNNLSNTYKEIKRLNEELEKIGASSTLDPDILRLVEDEIEPRFMLRHKLNTARNILALVSLAASFSFFFPFPINRIFQFCCFSIAAGLAIYIFRLSLKEQDSSLSIFNKILHYTFFITSLILLFLGVFFISIGVYNLRSRYPENYQIPLVLGPMFFIPGVLLIRYSLRLIRRNKKLI